MTGAGGLVRKKRGADPKAASFAPREALTPVVGLVRWPATTGQGVSRAGCAKSWPCLEQARSRPPLHNLLIETFESMCFFVIRKNCRNCCRRFSIFSASEPAGDLHASIHHVTHAVNDNNIARGWK